MIILKIKLKTEIILQKTQLIFKVLKVISLNKFKLYKVKIKLLMNNQILKTKSIYPIPNSKLLSKNLYFKMNLISKRKTQKIKTVGKITIYF